jgi:CRISPR/Cas system-associated endonuclease Cas3-HD
MQDMTQITRRIDDLSSRLTVVEVTQKHIDEKFAVANERMEDIKMMIREGFLDVKSSFHDHKRDVKEKISAVKEDTENSKRPRILIMAAAAGAFATSVVNFIIDGGLKGG